MKLFWAILSLYILILSAVPCGDEKDCNEFSETHNTSQLPDTHSASHHDEICSPFCMCACCGVQGLISMLPITISAQSEIKPNTFAVPSSSVKDVSLSIWQPPKIV